MRDDERRKRRQRRQRKEHRGVRSVNVQRRRSSPRGDGGAHGRSDGQTSRREIDARRPRRFTRTPRSDSTTVDVCPEGPPGHVLRGRVPVIHADDLDAGAKLALRPRQASGRASPRRPGRGDRTCPDDRCEGSSLAVLRRPPVSTLVLREVETFAPRRQHRRLAGLIEAPASRQAGSKIPPPGSTFAGSLTTLTGRRDPAPVPWRRSTAAPSPGGPAPWRWRRRALSDRRAFAHARAHLAPERRAARRRR